MFSTNDAGTFRYLYVKKKKNFNPYLMLYTKIIGH